MEREITDLRSKLKECEKERLKAAQYGLQLLERQTELQNQLDKCHEEMVTILRAITRRSTPFKEKLSSRVECQKV